MTMRSRSKAGGGLLRGAARRRFDVRVAAGHLNLALDRFGDRLLIAGDDVDRSRVYVPDAEIAELRRRLQELIVDLRKIEGEPER